jgi:hypothetical protein
MSAGVDFLTALFAVILVDADNHTLDEATGRPTLRSTCYLEPTPDGPRLVIT